MSQSWSIVIFCYNEEKTVSVVYHAVLDMLKKHVNADFEILIVDDGSTDNTEAMVLGENDKHVRYYRKNNGERTSATTRRGDMFSKF